MDYITFVFGVDNTDISESLRKFAERYGCDLAFEKAKHLATKFHEFDLIYENFRTMAQYDSYLEFIDIYETQIRDYIFEDKDFDSVLDFLHIIEDNTDYQIKEISQAINTLQKIDFKIKEEQQEKKAKESKVLDTINYSDIKYNHFNNWLTEALYYQCDITFDKVDVEENYFKQYFDIRDIDIQFREENDYNDDCDIAVYCRRKGNDEWEYVDNISRELYERRFE